MSKAENAGFINQKWGLLPDETAMIGDSLVDTHAALSNGIASVAVLYGYEADKEALKSKADFWVEAPKDLFNLLLESKPYVNL